MAIFSKKNAQKYAQSLRKYIGKTVVLFGGGSFGEENIVKLRKVKAMPATYYRQRQDEDGRPFSEPYQSAEDWIVQATMTGKNLPGGNRTFEPHLGSWRLGRIVK